MVNYETFITIRNKLTPFAYCFVAIFALLFVQFLYYSAQTPIAYVIGIVVTYQILRYGMKRNKKVIQCVPKSQQWGAFLLGCSIIASGIVISALWTGINPILNAYRYIPLPHMFYVIFLAPIGEEVIYRQMLYTDAFSNKWLGRIISGSLFVMIHAPMPLPSLVFYILATIGLFVAYEKSGNNLWVAIIVHGINNAVAFL